MRATIKKPLQAITVLVLAAIFIALGIWQLQRAQELQDAKKVVACSQCSRGSSPETSVLINISAPASRASRMPRD
jgi:cytochrome oxidase assembly protein ShyY1